MHLDDHTCKLTQIEKDRRKAWGERVKAARESKNKSIGVLAKAAGITREAMQKIELGKVDPDLFEVKIERALNMERVVIK